MKISTAVRKAWKAYTASFGGTMGFLLAEGCLTLICLAPLLCLSRAELAPGALITLPLWLFLLIPLRMNAAGAMRRVLAGGSLCGPDLISMENYEKKLGCGLKRVGFLLLWSIPLIVLGIVIRNHFSGEVDSFTVLRMIKNNLGGGDQMRGILVLAAMIVGSLLLLTAGCAFHSGARHAFARGNLSLVQGHHGKVILTWLASLLSILPLLIALLAVILRYLPALSDLNGLIMKTVQLPPVRETLMILGVGLLLTLPLLPLRSLIQAAYVDGLAEGKA